MTDREAFEAFMEKHKADAIARLEGMKMYPSAWEVWQEAARQEREARREEAK